MNIFFPSGGRRVELINVFKKKVKALSGKIVVGDIVNSSPALYVADRSYLLPKYDSVECYEVLKKIYNNEKIDLIIPLLDYELDYYVKNYNKLLNDGLNVMMSNPQSMAVFRNKKRTNEALKKIGVPVPEQYGIKSKKIKYPLIIKPVVGSAGMRVNIVKNSTDLRIIINQIGKDKLDNEFIIEEFVKGKEVTSDVLIDFKGNIKAISQRERIKVRGGEVERARIVDYPDVKRYIEVVFNSISGIGVLNIQCFLSSTGPKFTEINARFGGGYPLSYMAGCDFPEAVINMYSNKKIKKMSSRVGYHMLRYDNAIYLHESELIDDKMHCF